MELDGAGLFYIFCMELELDAAGLFIYIYSVWSAVVRAVCQLSPIAMHKGSSEG